MLEQRIRIEPARFAAVLGARPGGQIVLETSSDSEWVARCLEALEGPARRRGGVRLDDSHLRGHSCPTRGI